MTKDGQEVGRGGDGRLWRKGVGKGGKTKKRKNDRGDDDNQKLFLHAPYVKTLFSLLSR